MGKRNEMQSINRMRLVVNISGIRGGVPYRFCPHCLRNLPLNAYGIRKADGREYFSQTWCKDCRADAMHDTYIKKNYKEED